MHYYNFYWFVGTEVGINVQVVDVFKVTLVVLKLEPGHFVYYRCDSSIHVGVNLAQLLKVFQFSYLDDNVTLRSSKNENSWDIVFESATGTTCSEFSMALLNDEQLRYIIPVSRIEAFNMMYYLIIMYIVHVISTNCVVTFIRM